MAAPYLSMVVPCYNEAEVLPQLHARLSAVGAALGRSYEIVLVNDGSTDATWEHLLRLARTDPHLVLVNLARNHGHQLALSAGLSVTRGQCVLVIDADLQDPPELLPEMLAKMEAGADVVVGKRRTRPGDGLLKRAACAVFYRLLQRLADSPVDLDAGDFRLLSRRVVDMLNLMPERRRYLRGMVSWLGFKQDQVLYDRDARHAGKSKYSLAKLIRLALDGVTSFSVKPLRLAIYLGLTGAGLGVFLLAYTLIGWLCFKETPRGWTSLEATIVIFGSAQLIVLGILGEYIGLIYEQTRNRPMFLIDRVVRGGDGSFASSSTGQAPSAASPEVPLQ